MSKPRLGLATTVRFSEGDEAVLRRLQDLTGLSMISVLRLAMREALQRREAQAQAVA